MIDIPILDKIRSKKQAKTVLQTIFFVDLCQTECFVQWVIQIEAFCFFASYKLFVNTFSEYQSNNFENFSVNHGHKKVKITLIVSATFRATYHTH